MDEWAWRPARKATSARLKDSTQLKAPLTGAQGRRVDARSDCAFGPDQRCPAQISRFGPTAALSGRGDNTIPVLVSSRGQQEATGTRKEARGYAVTVG
jgi:hypothetical protein